MTKQTQTLSTPTPQDLRTLLQAVNPVTQKRAYDAGQAQAMVRAITTADPPVVPRPARTPLRWRTILIGAGVAGAVGLGGVTAVAGLRPAADVASPVLGTPLIINGVGPAAVILPSTPAGATYLRVELTCYDGTLCATPGGSVMLDTPGVPMVQRDALPLTDLPDPSNPQALRTLDPKQGLSVTVHDGTHWRLYAVYTDTLNPKTASLTGGRTLGIPGNQEPPDLVPALATNGELGWVDYHQLTDEANPQLTGQGLTQQPLPVYDQDGTTIIGTADVSSTLR